MAGLIEFDENHWWSAASWVFNWVLEVIARNTTDPKLADHLRFIMENNFGGLFLEQLSPRHRQEFLRVMDQTLVPYSEANLPADMLYREDMIDYLQDLVDLSRAGAVDGDGG